MPMAIYSIKNCKMQGKWVGKKNSNFDFKIQAEFANQDRELLTFLFVIAIVLFNLYLLEISKKH